MQLQSTDYMIPELDPNFLDGSLGAVSEDDLKDIGENLASSALTSTAGVAAALRPFSAEDRQTIIASFLAFSGSPTQVARATRILASEASSKGLSPSDKRKLRIAWSVLGTASMAASAFHGYRRNQSIGWALAWGVLGGVFPVLTPAVALAQGFGQPR